MLADAPSPYWQMPRLEPRARWLAGVASAIAREVGVDALVLRLAFVCLALSGGVGLALYAGAWLAFTFYERSHPGRVYAPVAKGRTPTRRLVGVAAIVLGLFALATMLYFAAATSCERQPGGLSAGFLGAEWPVLREAVRQARANPHARETRTWMAERVTEFLGAAGMIGGRSGPLWRRAGLVG